nr:uncharacterized protein LOC124497760 [Dermatophagoides farinae]
MIDLTFIERLRQRFEKEIETNPSYYHEIDIKRIREEEWPIKRFLIANNADENIAFDSMQRTYRWRNKFGIHDRTDQSFPREFWQLSGVEIIRSINGQFVIIEVLRYQRKCNQLQQLQYQFVAHCLEKVDRIAGENGFIALKDLTNAQHHNINFDLIEFQMIVSDHFPLGLQQIWLVNCPWIIRPFLPIVVNFLFPKFRQLIHYLQSKQLLDSIDREQIPKTLGGLRENQLMIMDTKPLAYMANELGLNEELVDILYKFFNLNRPPPPPPSSSSFGLLFNIFFFFFFFVIHTMAATNNNQPTEESIVKLRQRFLEEIEKNSSLYHEIDVKRIKEEEWEVRRFLLEYNGDENVSFDAMIKCYRWKKEYGIHERTDDMFPKELWELADCGRAKDGTYVQMEAFRSQKTFKELNELPKHFIAHMLERIDRMAGTHGFIMLIDAGGAGPSNVNMDLIKFKMTIVENYPSSLKKILVVDLPWILNPVMTMIVSFLNPKLKAMLTYQKSKELLTIMEPQELPTSLGGTKTKPNIPENLIPLAHMADKLGLTDKFVDSFYNHLKIKRPA